MVLDERCSERHSPLDSNVEHSIIDEIIKTSKLDAAIIYPHLRATSELKSQHPESTEKFNKAASKAAFESRESPLSKLSKFNENQFSNKALQRQVVDQVFKKTASVANTKRLNQDVVDESGLPSFLLGTEQKVAEETEVDERRSDAPSMRKETVEIRQITNKSKDKPHQQQEQKVETGQIDVEADTVEDSQEPLLELDPQFLLTELYNHNMKDILGFKNMQKRTLTHLESILKYQGVMKNDADLQKTINSIQVSKPEMKHKRQLSTNNSKVFGINSHKKKVVFNS